MARYRLCNASRPFLVKLKTFRMKKRLKFVLLFPLISCSFSLISCSRHNDPPTADCITRVYDTAMSSTVTSAQLNAISALFQRNNLSTTGLQFTYIDSNIYQPPNYSVPVSQVLITANVFINGLPTFFGGLGYTFYNDVYQANVGHYGAVSSTNDTSAHQTLEDLRNIYLAHYQQDGTYGGAAYDTIPSHPGLNWRDSCLVAMLGYADANIFNSNIAYGTSAVKAWRISPVGSPYSPYGSIPYPSIFVEDDNGTWAPNNIYLP